MRLATPRPGRRATRRRGLFGLVGSGVLLGVSGCASEELSNFGLPDPVTQEGGIVLSLWQGSWIAALVTGVLVWGLILWSVAFHRKRRGDDSLPPQVRYNIPIEVLYTALPFVMIAVYFFFTARDEIALRELPEDFDHTVQVVGFQWSWQFNYVEDGEILASTTGSPAQPPTLYLPQGEKVRFELTSDDVIHSFWVPAFLYKMDAFPEKVNRFDATPTELGTYVGKCAEFCGGDHSRMLFNVEIVSPQEYDDIIAELSEVAP